MSKKLPLEDVAKMVVHALRVLKRSEGCTLNNIREYIAENFQTPPDSKSVSEKISAAIQRGVVFGAIKKKRGHYKLDAMISVAAHRRGKIAAPKTYRPQQKVRKPPPIKSAKSQKIKVVKTENQKKATQKKNNKIKLWQRLKNNGA